MTDQKFVELNPNITACGNYSYLIPKIAGNNIVEVEMLMKNVTSCQLRKDFTDEVLDLPLELLAHVYRKGDVIRIPIKWDDYKQYCALIIASTSITAAKLVLNSPDILPNYFLSTKYPLQKEQVVTFSTNIKEHLWFISSKKAIPFGIKEKLANIEIHDGDHALKSNYCFEFQTLKTNKFLIKAANAENPDYFQVITLQEPVQIEIETKKKCYLVFGEPVLEKEVKNLAWDEANEWTGVPNVYHFHSHYEIITLFTKAPEITHVYISNYINPKLKVIVACFMGWTIEELERNMYCKGSSQQFTLNHVCFEMK
jgi:hypothetical protein